MTIVEALQHYQGVEVETDEELHIWKECYIAAARNLRPCSPDDHVTHCTLMARIGVAEYRKAADRVHYPARIPS